MFTEVPEAPYGLKVLDKSGRSVQLSWNAPYDGKSPIKKYLIQHKISKGNFYSSLALYNYHSVLFLCKYHTVNTNNMKLYEF